MAANNIFKPIHQPDGINECDNGDDDGSNTSSRSSSVLSTVTDNGKDRTSSPTSDTNCSNDKTKQYRHRHINNRSQQISRSSASTENSDPKFLLRRSSSAMRVRELRDVLSNMTSSSQGEGKSQKEAVMTGSQNARLLVASQQRLISRLQDLRHELDSMDNEVARVRSDIINSRRYFSAMTGNPCGPQWPRQRTTDSAYTSPMSFLTDGSPYNSDESLSASMNRSNFTSSPFQNLQNFDNTSEKSGQLKRSDSCSSFKSWRSDVELAGVFPEEPVPLRVLPGKRFSQTQYSGDNSNNSSW